ncbi:MAG: BatD family protein [Myxococcota bacterium]
MTALLPMLWVWLSGAAMALQLQLRAEPTELQTGQTGSVRLLLVSTDRDPMSLSLRRPPALPAQKGLIPSYIGQSSQFQNVNGRVTRILQLDYRVAAVEPGEWSLGPVEIELPDGSHAVADPIRVKVVARSDETTSEPFTVSATFDHDRVWEGQTVVFATRFESRLAGAQVRWSLPNFDGLRSPQHGVPADERFAVDDPDGTITVRRTYVPLVAVATGTRDQGVAIAEVSIPQGGTDLFGFQRSRIEREVSDRLELTVDPLPPPPPSFSGLVGDFEINSRLDASDKVAVGQSVPWSVVITGDGVIEGLDLPTFEADGASIYDNGSDLSARMDGDAFRSTAAFRRVVVPTREGALQLPPFELTWFSPARGDYVTKEITLPELTVVPGREGDGTVQSFGADASPEASDPVAIDLRPVYTWGRATAPSLRFVLPPLLGLAAAPGALVLAGLGVALARRRAEAQQARRGRHRRGRPAEAAVRPEAGSSPSTWRCGGWKAPLQALPEEDRAPLASAPPRRAAPAASRRGGRRRLPRWPRSRARSAKIVRDVRQAGRKA